MAFLRVFQFRPINRQVLDRARAEGVSEDTESLPRDLPRDRSK
jgi:hypothetical protein